MNTAVPAAGSLPARRVDRGAIIQWIETAVGLALADVVAAVTRTGRTLSLPAPVSWMRIVAPLGIVSVCGEPNTAPSGSVSPLHHQRAVGE